MNKFKLLLLLGGLVLLLTMISPAAAQFDCTTVTDGMPQAQCEALVALYNSTNGAGWTDSTDWLATTTPCSWHGVSCSYGG